MYYRLKENVYADFGTVRDPELPWTTSFFSGEPITQNFVLPLRFVVDNPPDHPPGAVEGICVPAYSIPFVNILQKCGIDNLQTYEAILVNEGTGQKWQNYLAVNIVGKIACSHLPASRASEIAKRPTGTALYKFHKLVIDPRKISGLLMFRLAEQPSMVVIHEKVLDALQSTPSPNGGSWGVSCFPIDEISIADASLE